MLLLFFCSIETNVRSSNRNGGETLHSVTSLYITSDEMLPSLSVDRDVTSSWDVSLTGTLLLDLCTKTQMGSEASMDDRDKDLHP